MCNYEGLEVSEESEESEEPEPERIVDSKVDLLTEAMKEKKILGRQKEEKRTSAWLDWLDDDKSVMISPDSGFTKIGSVRRLDDDELSPDNGIIEIGSVVN